MASPRPSSSPPPKFHSPRPHRSSIQHLKSKMERSPNHPPNPLNPSNPPNPLNSPNPLNPWIAVNLSVIWPGLGQLYGQARIKGGFLAIATLVLLTYSGWSLFAADGNTLTGLLVVVVLAVLYVANLFDAYNTIRPLPKASPKEVYQPTQNRWYAIFLSQILPGFGHLYFQQAVMGGLFLGIGVLTAYLANFYPILLPLPPMVWAIACYHLYRTTPPPPPPHPTFAQRPSPRRRSHPRSPNP
ncbi:MAG: hypothetical protein F6K16_39340, partial [Symploca sp. SIO2B6]|nr:hypothetical protein [Symploca sp. SIO2B6]